MTPAWAIPTRLGMHLLGLVLLGWLLARMKRRKKARRRFIAKVFLPRVALVLLVTHILLPGALGRWVKTARYAPQFVEAQCLRLYWAPFLLIPGVGASAADVRKEAGAAARAEGLRPELVRAVIATESSGRQLVVSVTGACGLMQLMPSTFYSIRGGNPFIARDNIRAGARYLRMMLDRFGGDLDLALAAYNAGPGTVSRTGGVPAGAPAAYVRKVRANMNRLAGPDGSAAEAQRMDTDIVGMVADFLRRHSTAICNAVVASLLMIFGTRLAKELGRRMKRRPLVLRIGAFVLLSSVGMTLLMEFGGGTLADMLMGLNDAELILAITAYFVGLGWFATREGMA